MKKILTLFLSVAMAGTVSAQNAKTGEVDITIPGNVTVTETDPMAISKMYLPRISRMTTFEITRDDVDNFGVRHIDCAQYVNGVKVPGRELKMHYRNGKLLFITGMVATRSMTDGILNNIPSASKGSGMWQAYSTSTAGTPEYTVRIVDGVAHTAYSVVEGTDRVYYDSKTGEEIERFSLLMNYEKATEGGTDTKATCTTFFYGQKEMQVAKLGDNKYVLHDVNRKIYTVDGTYNTMYELGNPKYDNGDYKLEAFAEITSTTPDFAATKGVSSAVSAIRISDFSDEVKAKIANKPYLYVLILRNGTPQQVVKSTSVQVTADGLTSGVIVTFPTPYEIVLPDTASLQHKTNTTSYQFFVMAASVASDKYDLTNDEQLANTSESMGMTFCDNDNIDLSGCKISLSMDYRNCQPALDVHWGLQKTTDYYKEKFGLNSFDNKGTMLIAAMNKGLAVNAGALGLTLPNYSAGYMQFGLGQVNFGGNTGYYPFVDLETIGHEFTHLVANKLKYQGESGALNESYADIMGKNVEYYAFGDPANWEASKILYIDPTSKPMRSFSNPLTGAVDPAPAYYKGKNWAGTGAKDEDSGGVHTNSSVQNHWFYIMCNGGTYTTEGDNPQQITVSPVNRVIMENVVYHALVDYAVENTNYSMARQNSLKAAQACFGSDPTNEDYLALVAALNAGWNAVGVPDHVIQTPNVVAEGGVTISGKIFKPKAKEDPKGDELVLTCEKGIEVTLPEGFNEYGLGIMFEDVKDSSYYLSEKADIDNDTLIHKITAHIIDELVAGHEYAVIPVYWWGVDNNLPDEKYWNAVDSVLEYVAFPRNYEYPVISIVADPTGMQKIAVKSAEGTTKKYLDGNRIIIRKDDKEYNAAGKSL